MTLLLESVQIALAAIWASKLRSFLTVLGNIVAVTSVIAVWSLVKGMDASVTSAILSEFSADSFSIDREGIITSEDEEEAARNNPRITMADAEAIRRRTSLVSYVMATAYGSRGIRYREHVMERVDLRGVTRDYLHFANYTLERGRPISPMEVDRNRPVALIGWGVADRLFKETDPMDKQIIDRGRALHRRRRGREEGVVLRLAAGRVRGGSARRPAAVLRGPAVAAAHREARRAGADEGGDGGDASGAEGRAAAEAEGEGQLRDLQLGDVPEAVREHHQEHLRRPDRHRRALARRRRHRHHEHHADGGHRADPRRSACGRRWAPGERTSSARSSSSRWCSR